MKGSRSGGGPEGVEESLGCGKSGVVAVRRCRDLGVIGGQWVWGEVCEV